MNFTLWGESIVGLKAALIALVMSGQSIAFASPFNCWIPDQPTCNQYVGKRLWVAISAGNPNVVEVTFTRGDWTTSRTLKLKTGASFLVTGVVGDQVGSIDYAVRLDDGRTGWVGTSGPFLIDFDPVARNKQAAAECVRRGQPRIGMTGSELTASCWGKPLRVVKKTTAAAVEESYVYPQAVCPQAGERSANPCSERAGKRCSE